MTTSELLEAIVSSCNQSTIVAAYSVRALDMDVISMRVYLTDESFIEVFQNTASGKVAFALISEGGRIYGKDNAKMGWHVHPFDDPDAHVLCEPVTFGDFLAEVHENSFPATD